MYPPPLRTFVQAARSKARSLSLAEFFDGVLLFGVLLVLAIYLSLIPLGHWQGDDYVWAWMIGARDWATYLNALRWAPRPIPQALLAVYFLISDHFQKPLIEAFLVFIWSFAAVIVAAAAGISALRRPVFISFLLLALTLLASPQNELFYWTSAAASYVPCWAALAAATLLQNPASRKAVTALIICLTFATLCSEVAAVVTLVYSAALGITALRWKTPRHFFLLAIPSACAIVVCLAVLDGRMAPMTEIINASSGLAGHWLPSVQAALPAFGLDLIGIPAMPLPIGILCKILLFAGLSFGTAATQSDVRLRLLWSSALLFAAFSTIVLANHQFGVVCCDRHANLRQGMILLALATVSPPVCGLSPADPPSAVDCSDIVAVGVPRAVDRSRCVSSAERHTGEKRQLAKRPLARRRDDFRQCATPRHHRQQPREAGPISPQPRPTTEGPGVDRRPLGRLGNPRLIWQTRAADQKPPVRRMSATAAENRQPQQRSLSSCNGRKHLRSERVLAEGMSSDVRKVLLT